jgi:hypothetical protein
MFANQLCQMAKSTSASQVCQLHLAKLQTPHCQGIIKLKVSIQQFQNAFLKMKHGVLQIMQITVMAQVRINQGQNF